MGGPLTMFQCDNGFEIHNLTQLVTQGTFTNYTNPIRQNTARISNPHLYYTIDGKNKVSYVLGDTSYSYQFNTATNQFQIIPSENYTNKGLEDLIFLDEALIYRDDLMNYIYFIDKKTLLGKLEARYQNYQLNYDIIKKTDSSIYQVFSCSNNKTATDNICNFYEINAAVSPITVHLRFTQQIQDFCGDQVRIVREFMVVSCWSYNENSGRIDVYGIEKNAGMYLIKSIVCNYTECYLGKQFSIRKMNNDHIQIYYTLYSSVNTAQIDMINVMKFYYIDDEKYYFVKNISENVISIDKTINRNLSIGVYQNNLLLKYLQLSTVLSSPICNYSQYFNGSTCLPCLGSQINMLPNSGSCEYCGSSNGYSWKSFENLLKVQYCNNYYTFSTSMLLSDDDQLVREDSSKLKGWEIALIIVLPGLFIMTLAIFLYCCYCKKDMKNMQALSKIDDDEQQQEPQVKNQVKKKDYHDRTNDKDYATPQKFLKNQFEKKIETVHTQSMDDEQQNFGPNESVQDQQLDDSDAQEAEILDGSMSFNYQGKQNNTQKPSPLKAVKHFENKNFPFDENRYEKSMNNFIIESIITEKNNDTEDDSKTLNKVFNSFRHRSTVTKNPSFHTNLVKPDNILQTQQLIETFKQSPQKDLKDWIKEDPKLIETSSCIICYHFFKLVDNSIQMNNCLKKVKHMAHTACVEKAIQQKLIDDLDCKICKANISVDQATMASPFDVDDLNPPNLYHGHQSLKRQLDFQE
eukprot:403376467